MRDVKAWPNDPSDLVNLESGGVEKVTTGIKLFLVTFPSQASVLRRFFYSPRAFVVNALVRSVQCAVQN